MSEFKRNDNESFKEYLTRIVSENTDLRWDKLADIFNKMSGSDYSETSWRKWYNKEMNDLYNYRNIPSTIDFVSDDLYDKNDEKLQEKQREIERLKIQLRDERTAWNKQNYRDARVVETLEILEKKLSEIGRIEFKKSASINTINSDNDILIMLSDFHIGQCFSSTWGEYNSDIAKERLERLVNEVLKIKKLHNSKNCYIALLGDMISGSIHKSIQVTNKENVVGQLKLATELISSFAAEMCCEFENVFMQSVVGNHTRIDKKEDAIHDERLDDVITWATELSLKHVDNFHVLKRNFDIGITDISIRGKTYIGVHGDYDKFDKSGISNLVTMLGFMPDYVLMGHTHTCAFNEVNGIKMIRGGSLAGSGDQYTIEKRLCGRPSQMVCVCNSKGVEAYYPIDLR